MIKIELYHFLDSFMLLSVYENVIFRSHRSHLVSKDRKTKRISEEPTQASDITKLITNQFSNQLILDILFVKK